MLSATFERNPYKLMAGIQLSGLASGMDWKTTVDQLMQIEQVPQETLKKKQALVTKTQSAFDTLKTNLTALKNAAFALQTGLSGFPRAAVVTAGDTSTSASDAVATTSSGAAIGDYELIVSSLGRASKLTGTAAAKPSQSAAAGLTLAQYGVTAGTVTINGTAYTITAADLSSDLTTFFGLNGAFSGSNFKTSASPSNFAASIDASGNLKLEAGTGAGASGFSVGAPGEL